MLGKYNGTALETMEKIMGDINAYIPNKIYKNYQYNIYWFINNRGYMHILQPCKTNINNQFKHYSIEDLLLTKDNMLESKKINGYYKSYNETMEKLESLL